MATHHHPHLTYKRALLAGFFSGVLGAIIASVGAALLISFTGESYPELTPLTITAVSLMTNLAGACGFVALTHRTHQAKKVFYALTLGIALLSSLVVGLLEPTSFSFIASPLHVLIAFIAIFAVPRFLSGSILPLHLENRSR